MEQSEEVAVASAPSSGRVLTVSYLEKFKNKVRLVVSVQYSISIVSSPAVQYYSPISYSS